MRSVRLRTTYTIPKNALTRTAVGGKRRFHLRTVLQSFVFLKTFRNRLRTWRVDCSGRVLPVSCDFGLSPSHARLAPASSSQVTSVHVYTYN